MMPSHIPTDACESLRNRVRNDAMRGHTTSGAVVDFVRRTCPCRLCTARRAAARLVP